MTIVDSHKGQREINMKKYIGTVVAALVIAVTGNLPSSIAEEGKRIDQMIAEAHTQADHEAIAAFYEKEAQVAHEKHEQHEKMRAMYAKAARVGPTIRRGSVAHCTAIAGQFEIIAKKYEELAQMHRAMGKSARAGEK